MLPLFLDYSFLITRPTFSNAYLLLLGNNYSLSEYLGPVLTRLIQRVPLVEQELLNLPDHLSSPPVLVGFVLLDL